MMLPAAVERFLDALPEELRKDSVWNDLFECLESYEALTDISMIAMYNPEGKLNVSKIRYLLFTLEAHLNEFYIFTERINVFLKRLERSYCKHPVHEHIKAAVERAKDNIKAEQERIRKARGKHVHEKRYFDSGSDLRKMSLDRSRYGDDFTPPIRRQWKRIKVRELKKLRARNHIAFRIFKFALVDINKVLLNKDGTMTRP